MEISKTLKEKALKEANEAIVAMHEGNSKKLWKFVQLSWRFNRKYVFFGKIEIKLWKKHTQLYVHQFKIWRIEKINFISPIMIDVFVKFDNKDVYRIRMIAEKKAYVTHPDARFRYNPNSFMKAG
jgi:hypothetical protein